MFFPTFNKNVKIFCEKKNRFSIIYEMKWNWNIHSPDEHVVNNLAKNYALSLLSANTLADKGITSPDAIEEYFYPDPHLRLSPFAFQDMRKAVEKLRNHVDKKLPVYVFSDKDVDGITGCAIVVNLLKRLGVPVHYTLPVNNESYGFSERFIKEIKEKQINLLITVDVGITENTFIDHLNENGIDVILTDHHSPLEKIPAAYAVINAKCEPHYPQYAADHSGCVAAMKLMEALLMSYWKDNNKVFLTAVIENNGVRAAKLKSLFPEEYLTGEMEQIRKIEYDTLVCFRSEKEYFKDFTDVIALEDFYPHLNGLPDGEKKIADLLRYKGNDKLQRLIEGLMKTLRRQLPSLTRYFEDHADLAAISTICDIMPLKGENRMFVKEGIRTLNKGKRPGIALLNNSLDYLSYGAPIDAVRIGNYIGPALNSAGRIGEAETALHVLLEDKTEALKENITKLLELNKQRKKMGNTAFQDALLHLESQNDCPILICRDDNIASGITGILAQKISRQFNKPAFVFTQELGTEKITGSGRANDNYNVLNLVQSASEHIEQFGGHLSACGLKTHISRYDQLIACLKKSAEAGPSEKETAGNLDIVCVIKPEDITLGSVKNLQLLSPFGEGNPAPLFVLQGIKIKNPKRMGDPDVHIRFDMDGTNDFQFLGWGMADEIMTYYENKTHIDIAFEIEINYFRGKEKVQLMIRDFQPS